MIPWSSDALCAPGANVAWTACNSAAGTTRNDDDRVPTRISPDAEQLQSAPAGDRQRPTDDGFDLAQEVPGAGPGPAGDRASRVS